MCTEDQNDSDVFESSSLEPDSDERDSAFGDSQSSYTMSVTSSVYNYKYENGRRYHAYSEGKYPVPNDEAEMDRLDLQHHCFRLTLDGALYRAPIPEDIHHVLDVGTGTGIWAIEFADEHPSAEIIGTDLSPIQPNEVPPNCKFLIDDVDQEWIFDNKFDFIHSRAMVVAMKDWDRYFQQAYDNLKPGGFIELQEITFPCMCVDETITPENSPLLRWSSLMMEAATKAGVDVTAPKHFGPRLRAAGFTNVHVKNFKWPVGKWAKGSKFKLLGKFVEEDLRDWLPSSALGFFTRALQWSREEVELFLASVRQELKEKKERLFYANIYVWYAQRPVESTAGNTFAGDEVIKDEEVVEPDDKYKVGATETATKPEGVQSPAVSAEVAEHITLPPQSSETAQPTTSTEAFKDSALSLASQVPEAASAGVDAGAHDAGTVKVMNINDSSQEVKKD